MSKVLYQIKLRSGLKKGLAQRDLVNEVVLDYIKTNPKSKLADLQRAFPLSVQKKLEIVVDEAQAQRLNASRKQYSIFEQVRSADGRVVAVCNQWGVANIDNFLDHARSLGYQIGLEGEDMEKPDKKDNSSKTYRLRHGGGDWKTYKQRDLVNEVVLEYYRKNPRSTLADLQRAFPKHVQKRLEIVVNEAQARLLNVDKNGKARKQYHIFDQVKLPDGSAIAICNQWGIANIDNFLDHMLQNLGYVRSND